MAAKTETFADTLTHELIRIDGIEPWKIRPKDGTATVLIGAKPGRAKGRLDSAGYSVRESDLPVRDGFAAVLEVTR